jgi:predicted dehydrogenase
MRVLLTGLGLWGSLWRDRILKRDDLTLAGIADLSARTSGDIPFFTDAGGAMDALKPDFVLCSTPPSTHRNIIIQAFDRGIPVLCEKPIAEQHGDVLDIYSRSKHGQKLMIAENYRYAPQMRRIKEALLQSPVGRIKQINITFQRRHFIDNYHMSMAHPMLMDVGIHHFDALRFLAGAEAECVRAEFHTPRGSRYTGYSDIKLNILLQNGIEVIYNGSLDCGGAETGWYGRWKFTGENGTAHFDPEDGSADAGSDAMLDDFIAYTQKEILPETHVSDNIKTYAIAYAALRSFESGCPVTVTPL